METIKYNNYEWYVIKEESDNVLLLLKNRLSKEEMSGIFSKDVLDDDSDVKFNYNYDNWRWADSPIRQTLNTKWLDKFNLDELNIMQNTINFENETMKTRDYIRLLTKEEFNELPIEIKRINDNYGYWIMTPAFMSTDGLARVGLVNADGLLGNASVNGAAGGVRPVISLKKIVYDNIEKNSQVSEKNKKIEKLSYQQIGTFSLDNNDTLQFVRDINKQITQIGRKINELIDKINKIEDKLDE